MTKFIILPDRSDTAIRVDHIDSVKRCKVWDGGSKVSPIGFIDRTYEDGTIFTMKSGNKIESNICYDKAMEMLGCKDD